MNIAIFSSSNYPNEINSFLKDAFLSWEKNEWYRYFPKENIKIDFENRILEVYQEENTQTLWAKDFYDRKKIDEKFLTDSMLLK